MMSPLTVSQSSPVQPLFRTEMSSGGPAKWNTTPAEIVPMAWVRAPSIRPI